MITDVLTILWKESRELFIQRPNLRGGWVGLLIFIGVFGVFLPFQSGRAWVESPAVIVYWAWVPFLMVSSVIADSFAGERERNTLETLLASRLSDRVILFGKLSAAMAYGWGLTLACILTGLVTVNLIHGQGDLLVYPLEIGVSILSISFQIAMLASTAGVLISLRAASVRSAQQTLSIAAMVPLVLILAFPMLPSAWTSRLASIVLNGDVMGLALLLGGAMLGLNIVLLLAAMARFQRAKLILD